jgi:hypothetical protein
LKRGRACKATRERSEQTQLCEETLAHTAQAFALQFAAHLARMTRIVFLNRILRSLPFEHFCGVDGHREHARVRDETQDNRENVIRSQQLNKTGP